MPPRWSLFTIVLICSLSAGCGNEADEQSADQSAINLTAEDRRFPKEITDLDAETERLHEDRVLVRRVLPSPIYDDEYPLDVCTAPHDGLVTAVVWLVDTNAEEILAVSPEWETVRCF